MQLDYAKVRKPIRALRKSLKNFRHNPPVKAVHDLRTSSRKLEATVIALVPDAGESVHRLLKTVKPLRKTAGRVRDMDVLAAKALTLVQSCRSESVERLVDHLHVMRAESAQKLLAAIDLHRKQTCRRLDRFSHQLEKRSNGAEYHADRVKQIIHELAHWPAFDRENLHEFRIKVKEVRYILLLSEGTSPEFLKILDNVKTRIGDWHDWQQLAGIAEHVLNRQKDRKALETIRATEKEKYDRALKSAQSIRTRYLGGQSGLSNVEP